MPGLALATTIAPERKASPLPSPRSELDTPNPVTPVPDIAIDDVSRPSPPPTLVPETNTLSTRPTRGGIAYPFRLQVEGEGREVNASTLTLQSVHLTEGSHMTGEDEKEPENLSTEMPVEGRSTDTPVGQISTGAPIGDSKLEPTPAESKAPTPTHLITPSMVSLPAEPEPEPEPKENGMEAMEQKERPVVERFVTADIGSIGIGDENEGKKDAEVSERPGVERFETAQEDLTTLAQNGSKA